MTGLRRRRVINGKTAEGNWGVLVDGEANAIESYPIEDASFDIVHFWKAHALSLDATDQSPGAKLADIFSLAPGSSSLFIESMPPTAAPSGWHRTNTIDYEYIISGRIDLMMEDGSAVTLEAGDVNIQLGGMHQWWNRYEEPCVLFIVMVAIESDEVPGMPAPPEAR
jgi:hypothetical protein